MNNLKSNEVTPVTRQRGMTAISMAAVVVVVAFMGLIALKLFPIYLENFKVAAHVEEMAKDRDILLESDEQIVDSLMKRLQIDDVTNVTREHVFVERESKTSGILAVEYEVRTTAVGNIDLVVSFVEEAVIR